MKFLYDLETTSLDHKKGAIHELSGLIEIDGIIIEKFNWKIKPWQGAEILQAALTTCNKTTDEIMNYDDEQDIYFQLINLLDKYLDKYNKNDKAFLIGYNNSSFDDKWLLEFFKRNNNNFFYSYFWGNSVDVMVLASQYLIKHRTQLKNFKLKTVAKYLGIPVDETKLHEATYDVMLTYKIYCIMCDN